MKITCLIHFCQHLGAYNEYCWNLLCIHSVLSNCGGLMVHLDELFTIVWNFEGLLKYLGPVLEMTGPRCFGLREFEKLTSWSGGFNVWVLSHSRAFEKIKHLSLEDWMSWSCRTYLPGTRWGFQLHRSTYILRSVHCTQWVKKTVPLYIC